MKNGKKGMQEFVLTKYIVVEDFDNQNQRRGKKILQYITVLYGLYRTLP